MTYQLKQKELKKQFSTIQADKYELLVSKADSYKAPKRYCYNEEQLSNKMNELMQLSSRGFVLQVAPRREQYFQFTVGDLSKRQKDKLEEAGYSPSLVQQIAPNDFEAVFNVPLYDVDLNQEALDGFANSFAKRIGGELQSGYHLAGFRHYDSFLTKILHLSAVCCERALSLVKGLVAEKQAPQCKPKMTISEKLYEELKRKGYDDDHSLGF